MKRTMAALVCLSIILIPASRRGSAQTAQQGSAAATSRAVDINRASAEELAKLPGIGPKLAKEIVEYRAKHGPFRRVEDLLIIPGIGTKKWKALRPHVCVDCSSGK